MKKQVLIGITGGIGGGKSTLSARLTSAGYFVYNSDLRARMLQKEDADLVVAIKKLLGDEAYLDDGELNRPWVAARVFSDKSLLVALNKLVHPIVRNDLRQWINAHPTEQFLFVESAIMFESGMVGLMDKVVLMTANEELRIQRVMKRDHATREQVVARMSHQMAEDEKVRLADYVIHSDDSLPLIEKMEQMLIEIRKFV